MKTLLTFGVYDMLHIGHILLFKHAKELFPDYECRLIVAVQDEGSVLKYKPNTEMIYTTEERVFMVNAIKYVDKVVTYNDVDVDIQNIEFDILVKGPDQVHLGFQRAVEWCNNNGKSVVTIPRTDGISSSLLKEYKKI